MSVSNRVSRRWSKKGPNGIAKAVRMSDRSDERYHPPKRVKRWFWGFFRDEVPHARSA
jgi:hypothetical protein